MGNTGARLFGMAEAPVPTKDSVAGCVAQVCLLLRMTVVRDSLTALQIDAATKEKGSGKFLGWNGEDFPW